MRKVVMYFILLFILIASSSCVTTSKPVHVIITAGQSNTDGPQIRTYQIILKHWQKIL